MDKTLVTRITLGSVFILFIAGILSFDRWTDTDVAVTLTVAILSLLAQYEFYKMAESDELHPAKKIGCLGGALFFFSQWWAQKYPFYGMDPVSFFMAVTILALMYYEATPEAKGSKLKNMAVTLFGIFYIPYLFSYLIRIRYLKEVGGLEDATGFWLAVLLIAIAKGTDIGAYLVGRRYGVRRIAPRISPGKTVEGTVGGLAFALGIAAAAAVWIPPLQMSIWKGLVFGGIISAASMMGDLAESMIKRDVGAKDSGSLFPAFGGFLDLIDSLLVAAPVGYYTAIFLYRL